MPQVPNIQITPPRLPKLYPKQQEMVDCAERYTIIEASTKAGKTAAMIVWLLMQAWNSKGDNRNFWWLAPVDRQAKIAYRRMRRMLRQSDPDGISWSANETEKRIDLYNDAHISFKGSDDPDNLYGEDVYAAVIDEACRCKEDSWHAVRSTLTATRGPIKIIGNVRGRRNWAYRLARRAEAGAPGMAYFKLTAIDAVDGGVLDMAELIDAKQALPDDVFKELYLAQPADDGGNPFGIKDIALCVHTILPAPCEYYGIDLAKSQDWTVVCGIDSSGSIQTLERWQGSWESTVARIISIVGNKPVLADSTGVGDPIVERLSKHANVQGFKFSNVSKQQLMEGLAVAIQKHEISIPPSAKWLKNELECFEYQKSENGNRMYYGAPPDCTDDGVSALALAVRCMYMRRVLRPKGGSFYVPSTLSHQQQQSGPPKLRSGEIPGVYRQVQKVDLRQHMRNMADRFRRWHV